jgi:RNA-directed DNA polymerase
MSWNLCGRWRWRDKEARFTALLHHVTLEHLRWAYWAISPKAAPGVDGVTWSAYGQDLEASLRDLHERVQQGRYRAVPSRRAYIPKADGRLRTGGCGRLALPRWRTRLSSGPSSRC